MIKWHGYILRVSCLADGTSCPGTAAFLGLFGFLWLQRSRQAAPFHPMPAAALWRGHTEQWILSSRVSPGYASPEPSATRAASGSCFLQPGHYGRSWRRRGAIPTALLLPAARRWPSPPWGPAVALSTSPRAGLAHETLQ